MIAEIRVPRLGLNQVEVTVIDWLKSDGQLVAADEPVVVIETVKVSYELPAPAAGLLIHLKQVKEKARVGDALGLVADSQREFEQSQLADRLR